MRLFIGIGLPARARHAVAAQAAECRRLVERAAGRAAIRWVPEENLHITLWFLGEVAEDTLPDLVKTLDAPYPVPAFRVGLQGLGVYPASGGLRVIWAGVAEGRERLIELHGELAKRLPPLGFAADSRANSPHVTLARVKDIRRADVAAVRSVIERQASRLVEFEAEALALFQSRTLPDGSRYETLLRVPLM